MAFLRPSKVKRIQDRAIYFPTVSSQQRAAFKAKSKDQSEKIERQSRVYNALIWQYLGLGGLLQYVPGTLACRQRVAFSKTLKERSQAVRELLQDCSSSFIWQDVFIRNLYFHKQYLLHSLDYSINLGVILRFMQNIVTSFETEAFNYNHKLRLAGLLANFPYIRHVITYSEPNPQITNEKTSSRVQVRKDWVKRLGHALLNPVLALRDASHFLHLVFSAVLEIGAKRGPKNSLFRKGLEGLMIVAFGFLNVVLTVASYPVDIVFQVAKIVVGSVAAFNETAHKALVNFDKELIFTTPRAFTQACDLRDALARESTQFATRLPHSFTVQDKQPRTAKSSTPSIEYLSHTKLPKGKAADSQPISQELAAYRVPVSNAKLLRDFMLINSKHKDGPESAKLIEARAYVALGG